jgi:hypothetical protein
MMSASRYVLGVVIWFLVLGVLPVQAQEPAQNPTQDPNQGGAAQPIPAIRSPLASATDSDDTQESTLDAGKMVPDTSPLAGAENISIGTMPLIHNNLVPRVSVLATADSDGLAVTETPGWIASTSILAGFDLQQNSGRSMLTINYSGGGTFSNDGGAVNSVIQQLDLNEKLSWRRVQLTIIEQLNYLPESSFGYNGLSGVALPGGGSTGLQQGLAPAGTILTTRGQRISNSSLGQVDTQLTRRSSLTFLGGYTLLHYFDNDLLDVRDAILQAGYNYQMTRKDTVAVLYRFSGYRYNGFDQSINDNLVQVSYGRRVTGRFSLQVAAGPELVFSTIPITPTSGSSSPSGGSTSQLYWSLNTSVQYLLRRMSLAASYTHGVSGGSGVLAGSLADTTTGTVSRQLLRRFNGTLNFGYSRNKGLSTSTATPTTQTYGYWFGGVNFAYSMGRSLDLNLGYILQYQDSNSTFCIGTTCSQSLTRNLINFGVNWHRRPIPF